MFRLFSLFQVVVTCLEKAVIVISLMRLSDSLQGCSYKADTVIRYRDRYNNIVTALCWQPVATLLTTGLYQSC